jgi:CRISPR-associated protein Csm1
MKSQEIALQVMQQAVSILANWVDDQFRFQCQLSNEYSAVTKAKEILSWQRQEPSYLRSLFDAVKFEHSQERENRNYCPVVAIADSDPSIPYPIKQPPDLTQYKQIIKTALETIELQDCKNLSLLTLIVEKYGSCLSFVDSDVALIDIARSTAAVACAIAHNPEADNICLIAGDLSGIQKFIYTISSDGALKSLRARSFYLELVAEEIVQQLLEKLSLPRTSIIYAGGGNLYLLASATEDTKEKVNEVREFFNGWLIDEFQGKIFLSLAAYDFPIADVSTQDFSKKHWQEALKMVNQRKARKFDTQIHKLLKIDDTYETCKVCHRDDVKPEKLKRLNENESVIACPTCRRMFELGGRLFGVKAIARSHHQDIQSDYYLSLRFSQAYSKNKDVYYHLFKNNPQNLQNLEAVFLINDWTVDNYRSSDRFTPLLLGNYGKRSQIPEEPGFMRAGEMAQCAEGINRVGYLRMDVDNLGKIFARGLQKKTIQNLPRIAGLSRLMTYFFKFYLNRLAENRGGNFITPLTKSKTLDKRYNILFIYAGGDDLFISGAWNEIVEFALDTYQSFREYTGWNQDITLSGGISINEIKYPLYQAASSCGDAEEAAKGNGRDSLGLFGEVFKWGEWVNIADRIEDKSIVLDRQKERYLSKEAKPEISDVVSFTQILTNKLDISSDYSRSFIRRLLDAAATQEQILKQMDKDREKEENKNGIRYYLHLPKLAYALSRLPKSLHDDKDFIAVRQSLMNPRNAPYFRAIATWIELLTRSR